MFDRKNTKMQKCKNEMSQKGKSEKKYFAQKHHTIILKTFSIKNKEILTTIQNINWKSYLIHSLD